MKTNNNDDDDDDDVVMMNVAMLDVIPRMEERWDTY
jgi:hypothetical protein